MTLAELKALAEAAKQDRTKRLMRTDYSRMVRGNSELAMMNAANYNVIIAMIEVCEAAQTRAAWPRKLDTALAALAEMMESIP